MTLWLAAVCGASGAVGSWVVFFVLDHLQRRKYRRIARRLIEQDERRSKSKHKVVPTTFEIHRQ